MSNTTPGYVLPISTQGLPKGLTLEQFVQTVLVGISGVPGTLVRPKWQPAPPKNPDILVNWISFGISLGSPDANSYLGVASDGSNISQRHEGLEIACSVYGPNALEIVDLLRDGFQIPQNLEALFHAKMGFVEVTKALHLPDLVNERWVNRYETVVVLRREVIRSYPIVTLLSALGTISTVVGNEDYVLEWQTIT